MMTFREIYNFPKMHKISLAIIDILDIINVPVKILLLTDQAEMFGLFFAFFGYNDILLLLGARYGNTKFNWFAA